MSLSNENFGPRSNICHTLSLESPNVPGRFYFIFSAGAKECQDYKILDEAGRGAGAVSPRRVKCDRRGLAPGWYRFQGDAGDRMPTECVPMRRCGTRATGWLNGAHPTVAEGAVKRKVCYNWRRTCCRWSNDVMVRNCGDFFVYELVPTPTCSLRYCGNGESEYVSMETWVSIASVS